MKLLPMIFIKTSFLMVLFFIKCIVYAMPVINDNNLLIVDKTVVDKLEFQADKNAAVFLSSKKLTKSFLGYDIFTNTDLNNHSQLQKAILNYATRSLLFNNVVKDQVQNLGYTDAQFIETFDKKCTQANLDSVAIKQAALNDNVYFQLLKLLRKNVIMQQVLLSLGNDDLIPDKNRMEKICIYYNTSDVYLEYNKFSVKKSSKGAYQKLLCMRYKGNGSSDNKCLGTVKYSTHAGYYSSMKNSLPDIVHAALYDLDVGQKSHIMHNNDEVFFVVLVKYNVLGDKSETTQNFHNQFRSLLASVSDEKICHDLLNNYYVEYNRSMLLNNFK